VKYERRWGCPVVSNDSMKVLDPMLRSARRPVLLWIDAD
jgi:hypothetical protein